LRSCSEQASCSESHYAEAAAARYLELTSYDQLGAGNDLNLVPAPSFAGW
jgi:hypothetical protein